MQKSTILFLSLLSTAAFAKPDLTRCQMNGPGAPIFINDEGSLEFIATKGLFDKKNEKEEIVKMTDEFYDQTTKKAVSNTTTFKLRKKNTHPKELEIIYGDEWLKYAAKNSDKNTPLYRKADYRFTFEGDNCYIEENSFHRLDKDEEVVAYNRELCKEVIAAMGSKGIDAALQCNSIIHDLSKIYEKWNKKLDDNDKVIGIPNATASKLEVSRNNPFMKSNTLVGMCLNSQFSENNPKEQKKSLHENEEKDPKGNGGLVAPLQQTN